MQNTELCNQLRKNRPYYSPKYIRKCLRLADELEHCSAWIKYKVDSNGNKKMFDTRFCRQRLCNVCKRVRYNHESARLYRTVKLNNELHPNSKYMVGTLTIKNVSVDELSNAIKGMNYAWSKMSRYKAIAPYLLGTVKSIETPLGKDGKCNLHMHILMQVKPSFYAGKYSMTHSKWSMYWTRALNVKYTADTYVRRIHDTDRLYRTCNYITKVDTTAQKINWDDPEQVSKLIDIDDELYRKRLIIYTGTFKELDRVSNYRYKRQGRKNSKDNDSGKHESYDQACDFNYNDCKVETYVYKNVNDTIDYYLKE